MTKIVLLPLDERPCNFDFPTRLFDHDGINIVRPEELGHKKRPADTSRLQTFLKDECKDADALVISMDMLLYGGLIPSRIHHLTEEQLRGEEETLHELKKENPRLIIYGFQVIMRCPSYSSSDEEPDYYDTYGELIHRAGEAIHKSRLGLADESGTQEILPKIPTEALNDYIARRQINCEMDLRTLDLVKDGTVDFMVIPQDDSALYGYAAMDQEKVRKEIIKRGLSDKVLIYPGADEVELTLLARLVNKLAGKKPSVYVRYIADGAHGIIPLYEGNTLGGTIKYHILAAGCRIAETHTEADFILVITAPSGKMEESMDQPSKMPGYRVERNLPEMIDFISDMVNEGRRVVVADNAYANGGDLEITEMLNRAGLLMKLAGYAGWNTSANTLGTAIAEGVESMRDDSEGSRRDFLVQRYIEDCGYCSVVRKKITDELSGTGYNYFNVGAPDGEIAGRAADLLKCYINTGLSSIADSVWIQNVTLPWSRMFEVRFDAGMIGRNEENNE